MNTWTDLKCDTVTGTTFTATASDAGIAANWADMAASTWSVGFTMVLALVLVFLKF